MARKTQRKAVDFWHASIDTAHFHFDAFAPSKKGAELIMRATFAAHCEALCAGTGQVYPTGDSMWHDYQDGIRYAPVELGGGYRDNELIYSLLDN